MRNSDFCKHKCASCNKLFCNRGSLTKHAKRQICTKSCQERRVTCHYCKKKMLITTLKHHFQYFCLKFPVNVEFDSFETDSLKEAPCVCGKNYKYHSPYNHYCIVVKELLSTLNISPCTSKESEPELRCEIFQIKEFIDVGFKSNSAIKKCCHSHYSCLK